jgi:Golgi phosphoprotein 3
MNRGDGLIRRNVARENASASSKENHIEDGKADKEDSLEDGDSKETRLTLMEEVLLLGLKDKEVCCLRENSPSWVMVVYLF